MDTALPVHIADHRGRYLAYDDHEGLIFSSQGDVWALNHVALGSVCIHLPRTGQSLSLRGDELILCMDNPTSLGYYADLDKCESEHLLPCEIQT